MKILFLHPNIPGQYKHLARIYGASKEHQVVFLCKNSSKAAKIGIPGVNVVGYKVPRDASAATHRYLRGTEKAVLQGQEVWRVCKKLKEAEGFTPDIICTHPGWGDGMFLKDIYPETPILSYFEFYYHFKGADVNFDPELPLTVDDAARVRVKNMVNMVNLEAADWGLSPTHWQKSVHPKEFHSKISVIHDGIDTDKVKPNPEVTLDLEGKIKLRKGDPIVTYVTRNFEHYRGSHHFLRAVKLMQERHPTLQILAIGADEISYGRAMPEGKTFRHMILDEVKPDMERLHFLGHVDYDLFLKVLQISSAHVYLTVPFVLSWSAIEAMSAGCALVASDTSPVREVVEDGRNGLLADFFSAKDIAEKTLNVVNNQEKYAPMRLAARQTAIDRFDLKHLLPLHQKLIEQVAAKQFPPSVQTDIDALYDSNLQQRMAS